MFISSSGRISGTIKKSKSQEGQSFSSPEGAAIVRSVIRIIRALLLFCTVATAGVLFAQENSPAYEALKRFSHGVNFGNDLEVPRGQNWGVHYDTRDLENVKKEGFDHVRLPIGWHRYAGPGPAFKLEPEIFSRVDFLVTNTLSRG